LHLFQVCLLLLLQSNQHWIFLVEVNKGFFVCILDKIVLSRVEVHHEDQMLCCPLINFEHDVLFMPLFVELEIEHVWINNWNYDQFCISCTFGMMPTSNLFEWWDNFHISSNFVCCPILGLKNESKFCMLNVIMLQF